MTCRTHLASLLRAALVLAALLGCIIASDALRGTAGAGAARYFSPSAVVVAPDGSAAYVAGRTADAVAVVDLSGDKVETEIRGVKVPSGLALSSDGSVLYTCSYATNQVLALDPATGKVGKRAAVGKRPSAVITSPAGDWLYVCNRMSNDVSIVDAGEMQEVARIPVVREPCSLALTPDGGLLLVGNLLPLGRNDDPKLAADISLIDTASREVVATLRLPTGCTDVGQICCSPDGKWAYVVSILARFLVPPTQIARGWINTNALSIIDCEKREVYATVLLDELDRGAANPYGVAITEDGAALYISLSGSHQITAVDTAKLHEVIAATPAEEQADLSRDLTFLYRNGVTRKYPSGGDGPRGIALADGGKDLLVANYFSDTLTVLRGDTGEVRESIALAEAREMDPVRRGELLFHDARICFQQWQSCASCHPDARSDGLRWDLLNDGLGNPKNAKSLLLSHATPPSMALGVRDTMEAAVDAGIKYIQFRMPEDGEVEAISAYLRALQPEPSPYLTDGGGPTAQAKRGKRLFESDRTGCADCHPAPLYTDLKTYDVGTIGEFDDTGEFDTPTLVELYRTSPYLHDGTAVTVKDVLTVRNPEDRHGEVADLSPQELDDLVAFLLSL